MLFSLAQESLNFKSSRELKARFINWIFFLMKTKYILKHKIDRVFHVIYITSQSNSYIICKFFKETSLFGIILYLHIFKNKTISNA